MIRSIIIVNYLSNFNFLSVATNAPIIAPCPDQFVGSLINGKFVPGKNRIDVDYKSFGNAKESIIVVVLESPHVNEYDPITSKPLGPAMGATGRNFAKWFDTLLMGKFSCLLLKGKYKIVFLNAVQYQCSLGKGLSGKNSYQNKKVRDRIFKKVFNKQADFEKRLKYLSPKLVINLCTKGIQDLNKTVEDVIDQLSYSHTKGTHPSRWFTPNCRQIL